MSYSTLGFVSKYICKKYCVSEYISEFVSFRDSKLSLKKEH